MKCTWVIDYITWIILIDDATNDTREWTNQGVQVGLFFYLFFNYKKPWSLLYQHVSSPVPIMQEEKRKDFS